MALVIVDMVIYEDKKARKQVIKLHKSWSNEGNRAIGELKGLAISLNTHYKCVNIYNAVRSVVSIGTSVVSIICPPLSIAGFILNGLVYTLQNLSIGSCQVDMKTIQDILESYYKKTEELENALSQINVGETSNTDFEDVKQKINAGKDILKQTLTPIIKESRIWKRLSEVLDEDKMKIVERISNIWSNAIGRADVKAIENLLEMNSKDRNIFSDEIGKFVKCFENHEGFIGCLETMMECEDIETAVRYLMRSMFFQVFLHIWRTKNDIVPAIIEGLKCFKAWIVMTPEVSLIGSASVTALSNALKFAKPVSKTAVDLCKFGGKALIGMNVCLIAWDAYSLYCSLEILANGSQTEQEKYIRELADVIEKDLKEKEKLYDDIVDSL